MSRNPLYMILGFGLLAAELMQPRTTLRPNERRKQDTNLQPHATNWCATTAAKWLLALYGAGLVVAFTFYIQAVPVTFSARGDCPSMRFAADAIRAANWYAALCLASGALALIAACLPAKFDSLRWGLVGTSFILFLVMAL